MRERIVPAVYANLGSNADADPGVTDLDPNRATTDGDTNGGSVEYPDVDADHHENGYALQHADADDRADADLDTDPHPDENGNGNSHTTKPPDRQRLQDSGESAPVSVHHPARFRGIRAEPGI